MGIKKPLTTQDDYHHTHPNSTTGTNLNVLPYVHNTIIYCNWPNTKPFMKPF